MKDFQRAIIKEHYDMMKLTQGGNSGTNKAGKRFLKSTRGGSRARKAFVLDGDL